jgi:hypothetical protein
MKSPAIALEGVKTLIIVHGEDQMFAQAPHFG